MKALVMVMVALTLVAYVATLRSPAPIGDGPDGSATLHLMYDGPDLFVDFDGPALTLLGFDNTPVEPEEHTALVEAHALLDSGRLIEPAPAARCSLTESYATVGHGYDDLCSAGSTLLDTGVPEQAVDTPQRVADGAGFPVHDPGAPTVISARWSWVCEQPRQLDRLDVHLFEAFERLRVLLVSIDGPEAQEAVTLMSDRNRITLR